LELSEVHDEDGQTDWDQGGQHSESEWQEGENQIEDQDRNEPANSFADAHFEPKQAGKEGGNAEQVCRPDMGNRFNFSPWLRLAFRRLTPDLGHGHRHIAEDLGVLLDEVGSWCGRVKHKEDIESGQEDRNRKDKIFLFDDQRNARPQTHAPHDQPGLGEGVCEDSGQPYPAKIPLCQKPGNVHGDPREDEQARRFPCPPRRRTFEEREYRQRNK